jgi:hypothetical protein
LARQVYIDITDPQRRSLALSLQARFTIPGGYPASVTSAKPKYTIIVTYGETVRQPGKCAQKQAMESGGGSRLALSILFASPI